VFGATLLAGIFLVAAEPIFDFTPDVFKDKLNSAIRSNTTDAADLDASTVNTCKSKKNIVTCSFNDRAFKKSISTMKELNLINGRFDLDLTLNMTVANGNVSKIVLTGSRADMSNLMTFYGTVIDIMQVFDPKVVDTDDKLLKLSGKLGLMRGDDAKDIGEFRVEITPYAAVRCLAVPSQISTRVACDWVPRS